MELEERRVGPDLLGVTRKRDRTWLARWLAEPEKMLEEKDPIIMGLYALYNNVPMPNMRLNALEVAAVIEYMETESRRIERTRPDTSVAAAKSCCDLPQEPRAGFSTVSIVFSSAVGGVLLLLTVVFRQRRVRRRGRDARSPAESHAARLK